MHNQSFALKFAFALATAGLFGASSASATTHYRFTQDGYADGALVIGTFSGTDVNSDGTLLYHVDMGSGASLGELTSFSMSFSGNSLMTPFSVGMGDLNVLSYVLGSGGLGDVISEGIEVVGLQYFYATGEGPLGDEGPGGIVASFIAPFGGDRSPNVARVTIVPDGSVTLPMFALSCGALTLGSRVIRRK
ncbi:MAG TPA: hypothetical protein PLX89_01740 [Verrucomicrobiota bacterium]|nr:hypothetical protein [Verrucomicrobiales bacterium]HRI11699.1 hypothetical protein [Verrucomicrobiota bacterium]